MPIGSGTQSTTSPVAAAAAFITLTHSGTTSRPMSSPSSTPIFTFVSAINVPLPVRRRHYRTKVISDKLHFCRVPKPPFPEPLGGEGNADEKVHRAIGDGTLSAGASG